MKRIKLQSLKTGKTKYIIREDSYLIEVGETLRFLAGITIWKCLSIFYDVKGVN